MKKVAADIARELELATDAAKCHPCGCFHDAVAALEGTPLAGPLAGALGRARSTLTGREYDCLGCKICWPANALNLASDAVTLPEGEGCRPQPPEPRDGWPPFPGVYKVLRYSAPLAVCALNSHSLLDRLAEVVPQGLSIAGPLRTENLGIERIIENVVANPNLRFLLICGEDTEGRIGHFPGQSLLALAENGLDADGLIRGAKGRRPVIRNLQPEVVEHFRRVVKVLDYRGLTDVAEISRRIQEAAQHDPGPSQGHPTVRRRVPVLRGQEGSPLVLDPAGYVVIIPDRRRDLLVAEHYRNQGLLDAVVEGKDGLEVIDTLLRAGLVTRADHAAYLGRELLRAEDALRSGAPYSQDRALGEDPDSIGVAVSGAGDDGCKKNCTCGDG